MSKVKFNELAKQSGKGFGPLKRIGFAIMFFLAPGSTLVFFAKTFLQAGEEYADNEIKEMLEAIKNA